MLSIPRNFSQSATSFIAFWCQGIHQMPLSRLIFSELTSRVQETRAGVPHHMTCIRPAASRQPDCLLMCFQRSWTMSKSIWFDTRSAGQSSGHGGGERTRTDDLLLAKQALSRLSYTPRPEPGFRAAATGSRSPAPKPALRMVGLGRLELPTSRLSGVRSNRTELQAPNVVPPRCPVDKPRRNWKRCEGGGAPCL